ncbi:4-hydroxyacetophenone monooxygenase, partial [Acinetobacter baumannii]
GLRYLDVKPEVQRRFNLEVQQGLRHTVWERGCDSWYKTAAGQNTNNWPGYTFVYRWRTRRPELADYDLARCSAPDVAAATPARRSPARLPAP